MLGEDIWHCIYVSGNFNSTSISTWHHGMKISVHFEILAKANTEAPTFFESFIMINKSAFHSFLVLNPSLKDSQH